MKFRTIFIAAGALAAALFVAGYATYIAIEHHTREEISEAQNERLIAEKTVEKSKLGIQFTQAVMDYSAGKISLQEEQSISQRVDRRVAELDKEVEQLKRQKP